MKNQINTHPVPAESGYLRLPQILKLIPIAQSSWWAGVKSGLYPKPVKLGPRTTAWRSQDISELFNQIDEGRLH